MVDTVETATPVVEEDTTASTVTPVDTPDVAPVTPEVVTEPAVPATVETQDSKEQTWGTGFGDPAADSAVSLMHEAGMTSEDAKAVFGEAVETGDLSKIDREVLVEKLGESQANLVMIGITDWHSRGVARTQGILSEVHTAVGGEGQWSVVAAWAKEGGLGDEVQTFRDMIDAGGFQAVAAANEMKSRYEKANGTITAELMTGDAGVAADQKPLTRAEYHKLAKIANESGDTAALTILSARRQAGRNMNL